MNNLKCHLEILVKPRAKRDELVGWVGEALKLSVTAPPVDGKANDAIIGLIARVTGVPRSRVTIISGAGGPRKLLCLEGLAASDVRRAIDDVLGTPSHRE